MKTIIISVRKLTVFGFLTLFSLILSHPTFAGTQLWDFEKDADGWKVANGNWNVDDGVYKLSKGGQAEHSLVGEEDWDDYTIEAKVRLDEGSWAGIVFRAKSEMEYYVYYLNVPSNISELWRHKAGAWNARDNISQPPAAGGVVIKNGEWLDVKIEVESNKFTLYINDEKQSEDTDGQYGQGKVGVWGWETAASFDDFTVDGRNVAHTLAVDPNRKLTTTWGRLKQVF
ncbi:MAG: DUF1080 domain-containing protein [Candidatus Poribacteria bacterium]|nr:DUF1080 domain-containing protein [Candidatus Poribacteria bacterium]